MQIAILKSKAVAATCELLKRRKLELRRMHRSSWREILETEVASWSPFLSPSSPMSLKKRSRKKSGPVFKRPKSNKWIIFDSKSTKASLVVSKSHSFWTKRTILLKDGYIDSSNLAAMRVQGMSMPVMSVTTIGVVLLLGFTVWQRMKAVKV